VLAARWRPEALGPRIELVISGEDPLLLSPEFISVSLCAESLRSIRLFLRAHGWKPIDERTE
jgi:hypothetical protein